MTDNLKTAPELPHACNAHSNVSFNESDKTDNWILSIWLNVVQILSWIASNHTCIIYGIIKLSLVDLSLLISKIL